MLSDRRAVLEGAGLPLVEGLALEAQLGRGRLGTGARGRAAVRRRRGPRRGRAPASERPSEAAFAQLQGFRGYPGAVMRRLALLTALAFAALAAPASAGSYARLRVRRRTATTSWDGVAGAPASPPTGPAQGSDTMGLQRRRRRAGGRTARPARTTFTAPSGMTIADFTLTRQLTYRNGAPASGHAPAVRDLPARRHRLRRRGPLPERDARPRSTPRAAGTATRRPTSSCRRSTVSRASFPALAGYAGDATTLQIAVGCFNGTVKHGLHDRRRRRDRAPALGRARRAQRPDAARRASVEASGLLAGGRRNGSDADHARRQRQRRHPPRRDPRPQRRRRRRRRRGLRRRRAHATPARPARRAPQGLPEPQQRDRPPDRAGRRPAHAQGPRHRRRRQRHRAGPVRGRRRHAVRPRPAQRQRRDRRRHAHRALHRQRASTHKTVGYRKRRDGHAAGCSTPRARRSPAPCSRSSRATAARGARFVQRCATTTTSADGSTGSTCARRRLAARPGRVGLARPRPEPAGERLPDAQRARLGVAARHARAWSASGRRCGSAARCAASVPRRGVPVIFQGRSGGGRCETFADGRANRKGRFTRPLPLPLRLLARPDVHVPREAPRRRALPVRARLLQARAGPSALRAQIGSAA